MSAPTVAAVMLVNGRESMVKRALASYHAQTYPNKRLVELVNTGKPIGTLRNEANAHAKPGEIIAHFDSDDWSHPNRIAEQVALLQSSGAECVGYNEMLFWCLSFDQTICKDQAWIYRAAVPNYAVGTSMAYWRETWERNPFPDRSEGCDDLDWFNRGVKIVSVPGNGPLNWENSDIPRMIASIHGGNTCAKIDAKQREWQRVPQWDAYCREAMKL
jgi:glycosyltransferase involved in cell wall biosynthesis